MYRVNLTYFKDTGKYYTDGMYESNIVSLYEIWDEVRDMQRSRSLPGVRDGLGFIILIDVPNHPHAHPRLII